MSQKRPKHLDLTKIRLPLPALVSILHRASGAVLFLFIWLFLYGLEQSLSSPQGFTFIKSFVAHPLAKLLLLGFLWAYLHHLCAGIRHLAMDAHYGTELAAARASSWAVLAVSIGLTLAAAVALW
ncbi:MAG: succinate dehydrogenase, cytochrome b556 subunit [Pseudomonadota bacterium]